MLTASEISSMRATVDASLLDTITVRRPGTAVDTEGNPTRALTTVATEAAWIVHPDRNATDPADVAGQPGQRLDPVVLLTASTLVRVDDVLTAPDARRYRVRALAADRLYVRAEVELVEA